MAVVTMVCMNRLCRKRWSESGDWERTCPFCGARCQPVEDDPNA